MIAGRNINNLRCAEDTTLMTKKQRKTKEPPDESERGEWKNWLKTQHLKNEDHGIWSHHCMANIWENNGKNDRFCFGEVQNHCNGDCSHEIKTLASWKKTYDQPRQYIKKQRHYFANKGPSSQSYGFPSSHVQMWEWTIKKAEHWRIDAFELWCWRRLLRVPWTARRSNQTILKEISPECSLEGLMLKLKLQYFGHLMWRADSCRKHAQTFLYLQRGKPGISGSLTKVDMFSTAFLIQDWGAL